MRDRLGYDLKFINSITALGFTKAKTFWKITFPQSARYFLTTLLSHLEISLDPKRRKRVLKVFAP